MGDVIETIVRTFSERGSEAYGSECVTQLEHALQSAQLASAERAGDALVAAALLHDIGHILDAGALPTDCDANLDDRHEERAYDWLVDHFRARGGRPCAVACSGEAVLVHGRAGIRKKRFRRRRTRATWIRAARCRKRS